MTTTRKLWIALLILVVLTPLGVLLPHWLRAGAGWGEWSARDVGKGVGYVPERMSQLERVWHAPLPDYGGGHTGLVSQSAWYIISALVGLGLVVGLSLLLGRWLARREQSADVDH